MDRRLLALGTARRYLIGTAVLGTATAALVVAQALLLANVLAPVIVGAAPWRDVVGDVWWLTATVAGRATLAVVQERYAHRAAARSIAELRERLLRHAIALGPRWVARRGSAGLATVATRGLAGLEPYFVRYLPQVLLVATVTPATLAVVAGQDWVSGVLVALTVPLVPVFMALIGRLTAAQARRRLAAMARLGHQVLDLLAGLPTLRALGRHRGPVIRVRELGAAHRRATMGTLRIAFLSGMVLELVTTLSVALVAVSIGLRLVSGGLDLRTGIAVLVLAPEVYLPLRRLGASFHAASDGVAAAAEAFEVLAESLPPPGSRPAPDLARTTIRVTGLGVRGESGLSPAALDLEVCPGELVALAGPNGAGKSTTAQVLLGLLPPDQGRVAVVTDDGPVDLAEIAPDSWCAQIAWVPQRPVLQPGTLGELVGGDPAAREAAATATGFAAVVAQAPARWETPLGHGGTGLSVGERQRLALTRALLEPRQLLVLDEPTAHLDPGAARRVRGAIVDLHARGRTVVVITHDPDLLAAADRVVQITGDA